MKGLVSILTPCYNASKYLTFFFDSLLRQTYKKYEIIFVDDGSTDGSAEISHEYEKRFRENGNTFTYIYQANAGQAAAINRGLPLVRGEYFVWMDSDDRLAPTSLAERVRFLEKNIECDIVATGAQFFDENDLNKPIISKIWSDKRDNMFENILFAKVVTFSSIYMIRTKTFFSVFKDKRIILSPVGQNWQILLPIAKKSTFGYLDEYLSYITIHADSHSRSVNGYVAWIKRYEDEMNLVKEILDLLKIEHGEKNRLLNKFMYFCQIRLVHSLLRCCPETVDETTLKIYLGGGTDLYGVNKKVWIYGACKIGKEMSDILEKKMGMCIGGFLDSDPQKLLEGTYNKKKVISMAEYSVENNFLIIPIRLYESILQMIERKGMVLGRDYVYPYYQLERM